MHWSSTPRRRRWLSSPKVGLVDWGCHHQAGRPRQCTCLLEPAWGRLPIIGAGGVIHGSDAFEHALCGASAVQIGTVLVEEGTGVFARLEKELIGVLSRKGYASVETCRGRLKEL